MKRFFLLILCILILAGCRVNLPDPPNPDSESESESKQETSSPALLESINRLLETAMKNMLDSLDS